MSTARDRLNRKFSAPQDYRPFFVLDDPDEVAQALYSQAEALELANYRRRMDNALFYTMVTGRPAPVSLGAFMSRRALPVTNAFSRTSYVRPHTNLVGECADTFENRVLTTRPFVQVVPTDGDFATRWNCRLSENFIEGIFDGAKFYELLQMLGNDAGMWGMGWGKVHGSKAGKRVIVERVLDDEMLFDEEAALTGKIPYLIQRVYISRADVLEAYGDTKGVEEAVREAPSAFTSQYGTQVSNDLITLLEGWTLNGDEHKGRHCFALPSLLLEDEEYDYDSYPFFNVKWEKPKIGVRPQGLAEKLAAVQLVLNRKDAVIDDGEQHTRMKFMVQSESKVSEKSLGNLHGALVTYSGPTAPLPTNVEGVSPSIYASKETWIRWGRQRVGLNEQMVAGEKPEGVNSGKGLRIMVQIEDARHKSLLLELEDAVKTCAELVMRVAAEVKPTVTTSGLSGRQIAWSELAAEAGKITVYPISGLSLTPADRAQEIEEQYAAGTIDKRTYMRLRSMPDVQAFVNLATAEDDLIEDTLDEICRQKNFVAPEPYQDLGAALRMAQSRWALEKRLKAPRKTLAALEDFMFAVQDLMPKPALAAAPAPGGAIPGAPGIQPPALPAAPLGPAGGGQPALPGAAGPEQMLAAAGGASPLGQAVAVG
jgi:hypothetical protein